MKNGTNPDHRDAKTVFFAGQRAAIIGLAALIFLVLGLRFFMPALHRTGSEPPPRVIAIRGAVAHPGIYLFHTPSVTVAAAIENAGGLQQANPNAIPRAVAAIELHTGQRVQVVVQNQGTVAIHLAPMAAGARLALGQKLDLNRATEQELLLVPKMQQDFAAAIVQQRGHKPWTNLRELQTIPGVGPKTIRSWANYLEVRPHDAAR